MGIVSLFNNPNQFLLEMLYRLPAVIVALSFHEWAHAFAAYKLGDPTARNVGRMTLNPFKHIDILGFIMMILFRFGWAKPVPINVRNFSKPKRDEIIVSLSGVITNFILAFLSLLVQFLLDIFGVPYNAVLQEILMNFYVINLCLMVFNLIPIYPLDGYHVLENLLIRKIGPKFFYYFRQYGNIVLLVLLIFGVIGNVLGWVVAQITQGLIIFFSFIFGIL